MAITYLNLDKLNEFNEALKAKYATKTSFNELSTEVTNVKKAMETLQGAGEGSVQKAVADAIAKIVDNAPGEFDTLRELAEWINDHKPEATAMNAAINENKGAIAGLKTLIGELPEDAGVDTIVAYIQAQVALCVKTADLVPITSEEIQAMFAEE